MRPIRSVVNILRCFFIAALVCYVLDFEAEMILVDQAVVVEIAACGLRGLHGKEDYDLMSISAERLGQDAHQDIPRRSTASLASTSPTRLCVSKR